MAPSASALLSAWEAAAAEDPIYRAPSLLHALGVVPAETQLEEMPVGQCDARLFELRRMLFGERLEMVGTCPACATEVELSISLGELQPQSSQPPTAEVSVSKDGYRVSCRIPVNADLGAIAPLGSQAAPSDLLERCLLSASNPEHLGVSADTLPEPVIRAAVEAMADSDPGAQTELSISCPCGAGWTEELDIRAVIWAELTDWIGRTLTEVHQLADSYGWSEAESLAIPMWRRRWYLEAAGW